MCAYRFAAAAILLAIPSTGLGQTFRPDAPPETRPAISVRFGTAAPTTRTAPAQEPAAPLRLKLLSPLDEYRALQADPGPCGRAQIQARADAQAVASYRANDWFGMSAKSRPTWGGIAELVGSLLVDLAFPSSPYATAPRSLTDRTVFTTAGKWGPPLPASDPACPPTKPPGRGRSRV